MSELSGVGRLAATAMAQTLRGAPRPDVAGAEGASRPLSGAAVEKGGDSSFAATLGSLMEDVNSLQIEAGQKAEALAAGRVKDLHQVVLAQEEATVAFKLVLEMRNKIVSAYQEIMKMPV